MGISRTDVMSIVPVKPDMSNIAAYLEQLRQDANNLLVPRQNFATTMLLECTEKGGATTSVVQIITGARETRSGKYYQVNSDIPHLPLWVPLPEMPGLITFITFN